MKLDQFATFCDAFSKTALVVGGGVLLGFLGTNAIHTRLHKATVQQCQTQAWPAHQHQAHVDFCRNYLAGNFTTHQITNLK